MRQSGRGIVLSFNPNSEAEPVAQTSSLLYRGFPTRRRWTMLCVGVVVRPADWKSAIQQAGSRRYEQSDVRLRSSG